jgi:LmbE family N-acetylglucosaminyl deacetylase
MDLGQPEIGSFDSLYLSPHWDDVSLACAAHLLRDRGQGLRVLIVTLFGRGPDGLPEGPGGDAARRLLDLEASHLSLGLPEARERSARYSSFAGLAEGREPADEECLRRAVGVLTDLAHRTRAREVFLPLALGGHIDHRLSHEAARAAFHGGQGRNVFFYEERPEAFLRGAVRLRLGQLGVRLPPAASHAAERTILPWLLLKSSAAPSFRGDVKGRLPRLSTMRVAFRQWRASWTWRPLRALGPRLQPVVYPTEQAILSAVHALHPLPPSMERDAQAYAARLGASPHAERYWLLLPPREADGFETLQELVDEEAAR